MKQINFIPVVLIIVFAACNSGGDKAAGTDTSKTAMSADTSMKHMDTSAAVAPMSEVPAGAKVFFKNLKDGQTVKSPVKIEFGVEGIALDTAGTLKPASGHHHLLIDAGDSIPAGTVIVKDSTHLHFGKAQTSAEVKLTPGEHTLTLQYADGIHRSYGAKLAATIKVKVH
jgi:hypothetical protein